MSVTKVKQRSLELADFDKRDVRTQFGALCWRRHKGELQILLVTSRRSKRWILPKGGPVDGATPSGAAQAEALEEAGAVGKAKTNCLGIFSYTKEISDESQLPCVVAIFPLKVKKLEDDWPEKADRERKWFTQKKAANMVMEPELAAIIRAFEPE